MSGPDVTASTTSLSDKLALVTHHHLLTRVPVKLDFEDWNYWSWEFFFDQLCDSYDVSKFIHGIPSGSTSNPPPLTPEELKVDKIILSWIFSTLSDALQKRLVIARPKSAKEAWDFISELKIESLMTILASLDSPVSDEDVVHYVFDDLLEKYNQVCGYMHYMDTLSGFKMTRSLLITEEMGLKSKSLALPVDSSSSYPMVLVAESAHQAPSAPPGFVTRTLANSGHATALPQAFTAGTLHDPTTGAWNIDTGSEVLRRLVSSDFISCNKEKPPVLCHACQLGKHVRLPFVSSDSKFVTSGSASALAVVPLEKDDESVLRESYMGYPVKEVIWVLRVFYGHFKLSLRDCPVKDCDVERMSKVSYENAVGSLMYLMVCTRPDIAYAVSVVSRYLANMGKNHWEAVKWILKYLRGTANMGLVYGTNRGNHVDIIDGRQCYYKFGASFTTEAEYMAVTEAVKEAIWLRGLLEELGVEFNTVHIIVVITLSENVLAKQRQLKVLNGGFIQQCSGCPCEDKFGAPYQPGGQYRAAGPGFYQRNNGNSLYPDRRPSLEESLTKFMTELAKRHEENTNIIKEIRASTDAAIRNQGASIKTLEIQIEQMSKVL
ncbi:hypothetical protein Tco_1283271 [Tanacetum coccineum]